MAKKRHQAGRTPVPTDEQDWLTLGRAAKYLGMAQSTIRKWSDTGRLPAFYTPGGHRRYRRSDLDEFLAQGGKVFPRRGNGRRLILIVDDDDRLREFVRVNLEMEGYSVREASSADDGLSQLGRLGAIWVLIAALAALLWRRPLVLGWVIAGDLLADWSSYLLRLAIGRDRPPVHFSEPRPLVHVPSDPSFPSGHASTSFACAALLAWLTPLPKLPLFALAALIAFSRVYNGVHYPLDVV